MTRINELPLRRRGAETEIDAAAGLRPAGAEVMKAKSKDARATTTSFDLTFMASTSGRRPDRVDLPSARFSASLRLCGSPLTKRAIVGDKQ